MAAIIAGEKTTTTFLLAELDHYQEPMPTPGDRAVVVDSAGRPVGVETVQDVRVTRLGDVDLAHAVAEGEGFASVADWRSGHESFWHSAEYRESMGNPDFRVDDDTNAVLVKFRFDAV